MVTATRNPLAPLFSFLHRNPTDYPVVELYEVGKNLLYGRPSKRTAKIVDSFAQTGDGDLVCTVSFPEHVRLTEETQISAIIMAETKADPSHKSHCRIAMEPDPQEEDSGRYTFCLYKPDIDRHPLDLYTGELISIGISNPNLPNPADSSHFAPSETDACYLLHGK